jgi:GMP reductase
MKFKLIEIETLERHDYDGLTYDLEVENDHSYNIEKIVVHNSVCTTREQTGVGMPQVSGIMECADAAHGLGGHVIADGGCTVPGDITKAFGAGADFVMLGGMLAFHDECGLTKQDGKYEFYGMSSDRAKEVHGARKDGYTSTEGKQVTMDSRGPVRDTIKNILGGLRSACTMIGARRVKDIPKCTTFVVVNNQQNQIYA